MVFYVNNVLWLYVYKINETLASPCNKALDPLLFVLMTSSAIGIPVQIIRVCSIFIILFFLFMKLEYALFT